MSSNSRHTRTSDQPDRRGERGNDRASALPAARVGSRSDPRYSNASSSSAPYNPSVIRAPSDYTTARASSSYNNSATARALTSNVTSSSTARASSSNNSSAKEPEHRVRSKSFFKPGKVLVVDWSEPKSGSVVEDSEYIHAEHRRLKRPFTKTRRFVIVAAYETYSLALAIGTHGERGVPPDQPLQNYGVIWTYVCPDLTDYERTGVMKEPVRVLPDLNTERLHPRSRVHYGKIYTIEHNVAMRSFGMIQKEQLRQFLEQWLDVLPDRTRSQLGPLFTVPEREAEDVDQGGYRNEEHRTSSNNTDESDLRAGLLAALEEIVSRLRERYPDMDNQQIRELARRAMQRLQERNAQAQTSERDISNEER